jgi:hypothetical protein
MMPNVRIGSGDYKAVAAVSKIFHRPNMLDDPSGHRRRTAKRFVHPTEVIVSEIQSERGAMTRPPLAKRVLLGDYQSRKTLVSFECLLYSEAQ